MQQVEVRESITLENNGEKIFGILHRPLHSYPVPAVIICPGFAGNKCGKFRMFVTLGKELARRGIAVLRFDYRGAGDSEGEFRDITLEGKTSDTLKCLDFLANDPQIDSNRLGLLGRSLGGAIAVLTARRYQAIKSLVLWAPVFKSDPWRQLWESFKSNPQLDLAKQDILRHLPINIPNVEFLTQFFKLDLERELEGLKHIPLLHIHGEQDIVVKIEHAKDYEQARVGLDNTRFVQLPRSDHDFSDTLEQAIAIQETCQWYQQTL
jgi:pimeloyl-ACP methyl ester carboxylesterase